MAVDILMPQLGESVAEGTIVKWLVAQGSSIERDQPLLEIETDKVALEIPSPASGILTEILVQEGETVPVGTVLGRLDAPPATEIISRVGGAVVRQIELEPSGSGHISPLVKKLAKEYGVDLSQVTGTGSGGRITKKDLLDFIAKREVASPPQQEPSTPNEEILPLTSMRKTIADRMVASRKTSAHVTTFFEADFSMITKFRQGRTLTYLPFVIKAVAGAIKQFPILNASWEDRGIVIKKDIHIGIAVALEDGLLVPVIRHADRKRLMELAQEVHDLAERARTKRLAPEDVQGGTFTITNHGGFGSLFSTPIIHQPQVAILGVGAVQKRAVVVDEAIGIRPMAYLSLSFDHRVLDGATADQFMGKVKDILEHADWEKWV
ncbi:MAG: 2-oxo acid dehydrogenase subunit E2 [Nitrospirae bacterium]|nr:MAG: 2-oxo acid dehydrogenase subunit E2 [Nitrospirota bacterium]